MKIIMKKLTDFTSIPFYYLILSTSLLLLINPFKMIWIDEFLQFAFGSLISFDELIQVVQNSANGINHNQTGAYSFLNFTLIKYFGVSFLTLRGPSYLAGIFLIIILSSYFKSRSEISRYIEIGCFFFILSYYSIFQFFSEARPYIIFATCTAGFFINLYSKFAYDIEFNKIFYSSVVIGSIFHPYFIIYLAYFSLIFLSLFYFNRKSKKIFRPIFISITISLVLNLSLFFAVWGNTDYNFENFDPFETIGGKMNLIPLFFAGNFSPVTLGQFNTSSFGLVASYISVLIFVFFTFFMIFAIYICRKNFIIKINILLILFTLMLSLFITVISVYFNYWIITRQWIGSLMIITICVINIIIEIMSKLPSRGVNLLIMGSICSLFLSQNIHYIYINYTNYSLRDNQSSKYNYPRVSVALTHDDYVSLGNRNLIEGGKIYPQFRNFYLPYLDKNYNRE
jgi:hypothetical protein